MSGFHCTPARFAFVSIRSGAETWNRAAIAPGVLFGETADDAHYTGEATCQRSLLDARRTTASCQITTASERTTTAAATTIKTGETSGFLTLAKAAAATNAAGGNRFFSMVNTSATEKSRIC